MALALRTQTLHLTPLLVLLLSPVVVVVETTKVETDRVEPVVVQKASEDEATHLQQTKVVGEVARLLATRVATRVPTK